MPTYVIPKGRSRVQRRHVKNLGKSKAPCSEVEVSAEPLPQSMPLRRLLAIAEGKLELTHKELDNVMDEVTAKDIVMKDKNVLLNSSEERSAHYYKALQVEKHKLQQTQMGKAKLQEYIDLLGSVDLPNARDDAAKVIALLDESTMENQDFQDELSALLANCESEVFGLKEKLKDSHKK
jgi:hypothetical protein